ncbi:MAG: alpha/beta hydrolase family protein [Pseudomonadales bacterium]
MSLLVKIVLGVIAALVLAAVYVLNPRLPTPEGEQSAALYRPGTLGVSSQPIALVDTSRPTKPNGDFEGSTHRALNGVVWYPATQGHRPFPLIVYSHGFMSSVAEPEYLVDFLVPKGYVVVAVDYPLSHGGAPGGPTVSDVINQPGDVSFVIDAMLARNADALDDLHGLLDPLRIAAVGLSLGGLTTQLAAFHRDVRDPRLGAAVSIAGPSAFLAPGFFQTTDIPFMMIAGSADAIIPYQANAAPIVSKAGSSLLVTLDKGSHVGFAGMSSVFFRWSRHPDKIVCPLLLRGLDREGGDAEPILAPDAGVGISTSGVPPCTMETFDRAMRPADQQMLTRLALYAFLEKVFAHDADRRRQMDRYLAVALTAENPAVTVVGSAMAHAASGAESGHNSPEQEAQQ